MNKKYDAVILDLEGTMQVPGYTTGSPAPALVDGLIDGLTKLAAAYPLFIVSNCGNRQLNNFLNHASLKSFFKDWECLGNSGNGKAENIRDVMKRNGLRTVVYVGDSFPDAFAADDAEVDYIHAAYGNDGWANDRQNFDTFSEIVDYLVKLKSQA